MLIICDHKFIISDRLNFQIIIEIYQSGNLCLRCISQQCLVQFARLAGTSYQKSVTVFLQDALWYTGTSVIVLQMRLAYQFIQINTTRFISGKNNYMVCRQFLNGIG